MNKKSEGAATALNQSPTTPIDIAMGFDANYAPHAAAVIASVIHNSPNSKFRFLLLHPGLDRDLQEKIERSAARHTFLWIEVRETDIPAFAGEGRIPHISRATLFRLGLETLAPKDCHRLIYLDADIVVADDLAKLDRMDLSGLPLGAAVDAYIDETEFSERWGLATGGTYFNAGILIIDLDLVRRDGLFEKALAFLAEYGAALPYNDQDALNWAFWMRFKVIPTRWNTQRMTLITIKDWTLPPERGLNGQSPAIVHFTGPEKPWLAHAWHPLSWLYWRNLARTRFFDDILRSQRISRLAVLRTWIRYLKWVLSRMDGPGSVSAKFE